MSRHNVRHEVERIGIDIQNPINFFEKKIMVIDRC